MLPGAARSRLAQCSCSRSVLRAMALQLQSTYHGDDQAGQERQHYQPLPDLKSMLHCHIVTACSPPNSQKLSPSSGMSLAGFRSRLEHNTS
jgi:hypothetical protein